MAKKLFIRSYGCQMNVYDSARMADVLAPLGYVETEDAAEADLIILNTCHIREKAAEKVYSEIGRLRAGARGHGTGPMLAVAGCVAQAEGTEIFARAPEVDLVVGPQSYHRLPELVARAARRAAPHSGRGGGVHDTDFPAEPKFDHLPPPAPRGAPSAFLTVQEGCDKFCAFCVVPYTRGAEYSRPAADVLAEARALVAGGAREIMLLGQNVNAYHGATATGRGEWGLARLIRALAEIDGLQRLRYTTSHPRDMDDDLIAAHGEVPALMPYLHLPVQSGSDDVLARMNRRHRVSDYLRVIDRLRAARPDIALASDFIVGHPGETDADFAATLDLVERVGYAQAYSFKYSRRPGTPAAAFDDQVPEAAKIERLAALQDLLNRQQRAFNAATTGRVLPVLIERPGKRPGQLAGRSPYMQAVHFDSHDGNEAVAKIGRMADVRILAAHPNSLAGAVVSGRPAPAGARAATA